MKCSKCGKEITGNKLSENWKYYCPECGLREAKKAIWDSKFLSHNVRENNNQA